MVTQTDYTHMDTYIKKGSQKDPFTCHYEAEITITMNPGIFHQFL